jgi:hypothetical protein
MKDVGIFYDHLVYFTAIWYIVWPFGIFYVYLLYFFPFWVYIVPRKNLATLDKNSNWKEKLFFGRFSPSVSVTIFD